ncbi:MAG: hypothetical protein GX127_03500 [Eubacteriaceae bacterium]|jgi:ATP-dependent helicase/nuclease subunit B|nr:hypothetical protein [Eubacteriaceae bacterium]
MGLTLLIGRYQRSGQTKSEVIYDEMLQAKIRGNHKLILLTTENHTLAAERELIAATGLPGLIDMEVWSFKTLAQRVFEEVGGNRKNILDEHGKQMVLHKSMEEVQEDLQLYGKSIGKAGFLENVDHLIVELKENNIAPQDLEDYLQKNRRPTDLLTKKIKDLRKIIQQYQHNLGQDRLDTQDEMAYLRQKIDSSKKLKDTLIWMDGFMAFNLQEIAIIMALAQKVQHLTIALTVDKDEHARDGDVFEIGVQTLEHLQEQARLLKIPFQIEVLKNGEGSVNPALDHLEREFFTYYPKVYAEKPEGLSLTECASPWEEAQRAAAQIIALTRERGYRYQDMVVVTGDIDAYSDTIKRVFIQHDIPIYIDHPQPITDNLLIIAVLTALSAAVKGYRYEDLFQFVKSGYAPITDEEGDLLENYVLVHGIQSHLEDYTYLKEGEDTTLEALNAIRVKLMTPLRALQKALGQARHYEGKLAALYQFLQTIDIAARNRDRVDALNLEELFEQANRQEQILEMLVEMMAQMATTFQQQPCNNQNFLKMMEVGLGTYNVTSLPVDRDVVFVGEVQKSRDTGFKALFVLGLNEGVLPKESDAIGLLTEGERTLLREGDFALNEGAQYQRKLQAYNTYVAFTRPKEALHFYYTLTSQDGTPIRPSGYCDTLTMVFPNILQGSSSGDGPQGMSLVSNAQGTLSHFAALKREGENNAESAELWHHLLMWYQDQPAYRKYVDRYQKGARYRGIDTDLSASIQKQLYPKPFETSVSRLETYSSCPFKHFVDYAIYPKKIEEYEVSLPDLGSLFHQVVNDIFQSALSRGMAPENLSTQELSEMVHTFFEARTEQIKNNIFQSKGQYRYLKRKAQRTLMTSLKAAFKHLKSGRFSFQNGEKTFYKNLKMSSSEDFILKGTIDRIDISKKGERTLVKVIDYKSGAGALSFTEIYHGLTLQLLVYLMVALEDRQAAGDWLVPGGSFYFYIRDSVVPISKITAEEITKSVEDQFKMDGLFLDDIDFFEAMDEEKGTMVFKARSRSMKLTEDEFTHLLSKVRAKVIALAEAINQGDIAVAPIELGDQTPCSYCDYKALCQIDEEINQKDYRRIYPDNQAYRAILVSDDEEDTHEVDR